MFRIKLTAKARKELKRLSTSHKITIALIFEDIREDPNSGKPLSREFVRRFSYRVGVYRIIYKIDYKDQIIYILTAGHRSSVYIK